MSTTSLLFVSHSHEDDPFCLRLIADLRANLGDEAVWYDTSGGLHGGDDWWDRIIAEITARPYFLVVLSPNASASKWVPEEMAIAYRQKVELGKHLLPVRLADAPRREDWKGIQEFDFTHAGDPARYAAALTEVLREVDRTLTTPVIGAPSVSPTPAAPERPLSPTERLAQETHTAYAREHWSDVLDKTEILVERGAMTPALWRERASAAFALGNNSGGLAVVKQALQAGVDDADTLLLYARLTGKAGDDIQAVEILSRAYALASLDDIPTRLVVLEELTSVLDRLGLRDEFARRVMDARHMAPDDPAWALRSVKALQIMGRHDESIEVVRSLPAGANAKRVLPAWRTAISSAAGGSWDGKNRITYHALLDAATAAGIDPSTIARWQTESPRFVPLVTLSDLGDYVRTMRSMAWSHDGTRLAIVGGRGGGIWNAASGRLMVTLSDRATTSMKRMFANLFDSYHPPTILSSVTWSPDGRRLAAATDEIGILARVWDATSGRSLMTLPGSRSSYAHTVVAWSPDGARIATAGSDWGMAWDNIAMWDTASGRSLLTISDGRAPMAWSPDGVRLATRSKGGATVRDAANGHPLIAITPAGSERAAATTLAWSPDGTRLVIGGDSGFIGGIWDVTSGRQLVPLSGGMGDTSWTLDGVRLVGTMFGIPAMWDAASGQEITIGVTSSRLPRGVQSVAWALDGMRVAVADELDNQDSVTIWGAR